MHYKISDHEWFVNDVVDTRFLEAPKVVGYYLIGGSLHLQLSKRPRWLTRKLMKLLIEWEWHDA